MMNLDQQYIETPMESNIQIEEGVLEKSIQISNRISATSSGMVWNIFSNITIINCLTYL